MPAPRRPPKPCDCCAVDLDFLRSPNRPNAIGLPPIRAVDLFAGCGGMSVGLAEAARRAARSLDVALAVDADPEVLAIYKRNLPRAAAIAADMASLFHGALGSNPSKAEAALAAAVGHVDALVGGPPCQGHSDLNNHTRRDDPKNALYLSMARAAEVLNPRVVVVENVPPVQWDKSRVVHQATAALERAGYAVAGRVLDLTTAGVPQRRRRFVLLASRVPGFDHARTLAELGEAWKNHEPRSVRWAIADLLKVTKSGTFDTPSARSEKNRRRMAYLFEHGRYDLPNSRRPKCHRDGDHSYVSVYGRLRWDEPAPTITTGFGSMGQGRYVHPQRRRTITPHEAARLQTFPDWFDFGKDARRGVLAKAIGNAVPPLLMVALGARILAALAAEDAATERKRA